MTPAVLTNLGMAAFLAGIYFGTVHVSHISLWIIGSCLGCTYFLRRYRLWMLVFIMLFSFLTGISYISWWRNKHRTDFPDRIETTAKIVSAPDERATSTFLTVQPEYTTGRLLVKTDRYPKRSFGETIKISGKIELPEAFNGFDYPLFLERERIYAIMPFPKIEPVRDAPFSTTGLLYTIRNRTEQYIQKYISEPESSFLAGILLGSKRAIPEEIQDALRTTGTSHIVAISGANITIILTLLLRFLPLYTLRHQFLATAGIGAFISVLSGASASVVRGAFVAGLSRYIRMKGRKAWATPLVLCTMTIMLFHNPLLLVADPGFQLSFAAYCGLLYLGSPLQTLINKLPILSALPEIVRAPFTETLAASIGTAPVAWFLFGQLALLGLIVNPLILWLLPAITFLGLLFIALGFLAPLSAVLALPLWVLLHTVLRMVRWFARYDFATIQGKL